jgi:hypothetical protein
LSDDARVIIIEESGWSIEDNDTYTSGAYNSGDVTNDAKFVIARKSDGECLAYGNVNPVFYVPPARGLFAGGRNVGGTYYNIIDYITLGTPGDATDFGDTVSKRIYMDGTSNGATDRGVWGGGNLPAQTDAIDYVTISTTANANDFGNLTVGRGAVSSTSNGTGDRGIFAGAEIAAGGGTHRNIIDYITISSTGNATDFGDLTATGREYTAAVSNATNNRGCFGGGNGGVTIDYITITSTGNAQDFGDLTQGRNANAGCDNGTNDRGLFGGSHSGYYNIIDYITISTTGNSTDFGDQNELRGYSQATSNGTNEQGVFAGGRNNVGTTLASMDYVTINTTGDAQDFGDLTTGRYGLAACSNA